MNNTPTSKPGIFIVLLFALVISLACATVNNVLPSNATPTGDLAATQAAVYRAATEQVQATELAAGKTATATAKIALATGQAQSTATAVQGATHTAVAHVTNTVIALVTRGAQERRERVTATAASRQAATREAIAQKTARAANFEETVQELVEDGYLATAEGKYKRLDDFFASWAQINYYEWDPTGEFPTEFVIRADASWNTASDKSNWFNSGCGFVYAEDGRNDHHLTYLGLDGYVYSLYVKNGFFHPIGYSYAGKLDIPEGGAELMLIVEGGRLTFFVDGRRVLREADSTYKKGELGLTLLSGTNKSYGTRCTMENIDLWVIK
jgi:hypothetical protein